MTTRAAATPAPIKLRCSTCGHVIEWNGKGKRARVCQQPRKLNPEIDDEGMPVDGRCGGVIVKVRGGKFGRDDLKAAEHCRAMRVEAEGRLSRAMTSIKLWSERERYYLDKAAGKIRRGKPSGQSPKRDRLSRALDLD